MSVCQDCVFWQYNFPHIAGVCSLGPCNLLGRCAPVSAELVGDQLASEYEQCVATWQASTCLYWEAKDDFEQDIPYIDVDGSVNSWLEDDDGTDD